MPDDGIKKALSISRASFDRWTLNKRKDYETQLQQQIYNMWLACEPQNKIAEVVDISPQRVNEIIADKSGSAQVSKNGFFSDFEHDGSSLRIYDIWNLSNATNEVRQLFTFFRTFYPVAFVKSIIP